MLWESPNRTESPWPQGNLLTQLCHRRSFSPPSPSPTRASWNPTNQLRWMLVRGRGLGLSVSEVCNVRTLCRQRKPNANGQNKKKGDQVTHLPESPGLAEPGAVSPSDLLTPGAFILRASPLGPLQLWAQSLLASSSDLGCCLLPRDGQWPAELGWTSPTGHGRSVFSVLLLNWGFAPQLGGFNGEGRAPNRQWKGCQQKEEGSAEGGKPSDAVLGPWSSDTAH